VPANTPSPLPPPPPTGNETKDQRPPAVTAAPNGSPGTGDNWVSPAGSWRADAVAALQPGVLTLDTAGLAGTGREAGAVRGAPEVHPATARASAAAAAGRAVYLTVRR